jgi:hypothetical protein
MDANRSETRSHGTLMTRCRTLGLLTGGLLALTVRQVRAQVEPKPPEPEPEPPVTTPVPAPTVVTISVPVATPRKPRKPRKRRGTRKRH